MSKVKNSLILFSGLMLLAGILAVLLTGVRSVQGNSDKKASSCEPRKFYLTSTFHDGNETLSACADGYHMASLWEIHDPTNLRYDTTLGFTRRDSGTGPPSLAFGWVRTGGDADESGLPGTSNCNAWTSENPFGEGTAVALPRLWRPTDLSVINPWTSAGGLCSEPIRVWCAQN